MSELKETEAESSSTDNEVKLLEPGEVIKPIVPEGIVPDLVLRLYGLKVITCKELVSYDDKNYHVNVAAEDWDNKYISEVCPEGYVLKILNSMDSKRPQLIEAQHAFMQHLRNNGIHAQEAVLNVHGTDMFLEKISVDKKGGSYLVRLMKFIPGTVLGSVVLTRPTLYNTGRFIGLMHHALKKFHHPFYDTFDTVWSLTHTGDLMQFATSVENPSNLAVCEQVIDAFKSCVVPRYNQLQEGIIHGDTNENNILVTAMGGQENKMDDNIDYDVSGIIDFSDVCKSYFIFDIVIAITYLCICSTKIDQLDVPGYILAGYLSERSLNDTEMEILKVCICSRLTQSLVMGSYSHAQDPTNFYVLDTAKRGWPLLHKFWSAPNEELLATWNSIIREYNIDK